MQNLACQWVFAFGKLEIFVHIFFYSEHTLENAEKLSQFNECIYPFEPTGRGMSLDTCEFCWTYVYCREREKCHRMHNLTKLLAHVAECLCAHCSLRKKSVHERVLFVNRKLLFSYS